MIKRLRVQLADRSYPIILGRELLSDSAHYPAAARTGRLIVVTNETVAPLYLDSVLQALQAADTVVYEMPDGERYKSFAQCQKILDLMLRKGLARDSYVVALGGGVVGDLAGFAAAIYQRGINLLQIPTTLLAQVDSSVGGKTAVNHRLGKNMIGAFHQPRTVIADMSTLRSLPERELRAGIAEIIKYGLIGDRRFIGWLEKNMSALLARDETALAHAVAVSCRHKARVVAADERESGQRALVNLGHTFGHAIEAHQKYREWLHGEAVAVGLCMASDLSCRLGWLNAADRDRAIALVELAGLPSAPPPGLRASRMRRLMQGDKKVAAGKLRLVLLPQLGQACLSAEFGESALADCLQSYCSPR